MPFFERRERALLLKPRVSGTCSDDDGDKGALPLAFVSISLSQRAVRVDFLWRLLEAISGGERSSSIDNIETSGHLFCGGDEIYLGQGWGDIVIAFSRGSDPVGRLRDIFCIQNVIYEDFMVDRTELILSANCLRYAAEQEERYRVFVQFRVKEGQFLGNSNRDIVEAIAFNAAAEGVKIDLMRTPGRTDFMLLLNKLDMFKASDAGPLKVLLKLFGTEVSQLGEIMTTLAVREPAFPL